MSEEKKKPTVEERLDMLEQVVGQLGVFVIASNIHRPEVLKAITEAMETFSAIKAGKAN